MVMEKPQRQVLLVMRHGLRQDEVDPSWVQSAERPWDPPLAEEGRKDLPTAASAIREFEVEKVVSSPFKRCLQTASCICRELQPPLDTIEIDYAMCEILGPTYFAGAGGPARDQSVEDWLWCGEEPSDAIASGVESDSIRAAIAGTDFPEVPETLPQAHARYAKAIEEAADRAGGRNLLIVTHGEAVGKSVTRLLPWVSVFHVQHCGFTVAWREVHGKDDYGLWQLDSDVARLERGVFWRDRSALLGKK